MAKEGTFSSVLDAPVNAAERPPMFPAGNYVAVISGQPKQGESTQKKTPFVEYTIRPLEAVTDTVDEDALKEFGPLGEAEMRLTFYITEKSAYRHREFLENDLGIDTSGGEGHFTLAQQAPGSQLIITVRHKPREDGKGVFAEIAGTAPLE